MAESEHSEPKTVTPQDKALAYLQKSGIINAYEYLLTSLCENGLPTGNLYEFSALMMLKYEKRMKSQALKAKQQMRQSKQTAMKGGVAEEVKKSPSPQRQAPAKGNAAPSAKKLGSDAGTNRQSVEGASPKQPGASSRRK